MLILTRNRGEEVYIDGEKIKIVILGIKGQQVRLGFEAPPEIAIHRKEIYEKIERASGANNHD